MWRMLKRFNSFDPLQKINCPYLDQSSHILEFDHLSSRTQKDFLYQAYYNSLQTPTSPAQRINSYRMLQMSQSFQSFTHKKFANYKRYSGQGTQTLVPCIYSILQNQYSYTPYGSVVLTLAHRGKLALLASVMNYPLRNLFWVFKGNCSFSQELNKDFYYFTDDTSTHLALTTQRPEFKGMSISMMNNPSHLEINGPVGAGKARSKIDREKETLLIWVHGDAAMTGQGVVYETAQMAKLEGYSVDGTIHVVANNQLGFTTPPEQGRSSKYCTDVFKIIQAPIVHVNAQDVEMISRISKIAVQYRNKFRNDFCIDLVGYRKYGHNEVDEPAITNPGIYHVIRNEIRNSTERYSEYLVQNQVITQQGVQKIKDQLDKYLQSQYELSELQHLKKNSEGLIDIDAFKGKWQKMSIFHNNQPVKSGYDLEKLRKIGTLSVQVPSDLKIHPIAAKHISQRKEKIQSGLIDWSTAQALAIGSLLQQGINVRLAGQDSIRGTFTQRHGGFFCQQNQSLHIPFNSLRPGKFFLVNSLLSQEATMAFQYGYSLDHPDNLVLWQAQFGDFVNVAQTVIDQFLKSGEAKWLKQSGLVLLLPHGQEGMGPDHSSGKLQRFFSCVNDPLAIQMNIQVHNPVVPSNFFHLLRRQMIRNFRRPLVVGTPKSGLRNKLAQSSIEDFGIGKEYKPVICKQFGRGSKYLFICNGKVYLDLAAQYEKEDFSVLLMELLAPFPLEEVREEFMKGRYEGIVWVQEEPLNVGFFPQIEKYFQRVTLNTFCVSRPPLSASAINPKVMFQRESQEIYRKISEWLSQQ